MSDKKAESSKFCRIFNAFVVHLKSCTARSHVPKNCVHDFFIANVYFFVASLQSNVRSNLFAKINFCLHTGIWLLTSSNRCDFLELKQNMHNTQVHEVDAITWDGLHVSNVLLGQIWNCTRTSGNFPAWFHMDWHSFIMWLALKERLLTKGRMNRFGIIFIWLMWFAGCSYVSNVIFRGPFLIFKIGENTLKAECFETWQWDGELNWLLSFLNIAIYQVWRERNHRMHCQMGRTDVIKMRPE